MTAAASTTARRAFLSRRFTPEVEARFAQRYEVSQNDRNDRILSEDELIQAAQGCHYLVVSAMEKISRSVIEALSPTLIAIATLSVGYDHIDLDAAREFHIAVFYSPGVLSEACAEIALLLLLNAARRGYEADSLIRRGQWTGYSPTQLLGVGLAGRNAGILGMGRIGQEVARRVRPFGIAIHYHNRRRLAPAQELGASYQATPEALLAVSDFLFLSAPSTTGLAGFLNRERIALLPTRAIVVNISRGDTVDDSALIEALESGRIFAAGLDVFANEPNLDPRYKALPNVFLTPHIGSATVDTRNAMGFILLDGLAALEEGRTVENRLC